MYSHTESLLHVSAILGHHHSGIRHRKRKTQHWLIMAWMCNCRVSQHMLKLYRNGYRLLQITRTYIIKLII